MGGLRRVLLVLPCVLLVAGCSLISRFTGGKLPIQTDSAAWKQVTMEPTGTASAPGIYFRDLKTGKTEAWQPADAAASTLRLSARVFADDLVQATVGEKAYLINRSAAKVAEWSAADVALVAASGQRVLFRTATGQFYVTDANFAQQGSFKLPAEATGDVLGAISPDGKTAALVPGNGSLYLVDLPKGTPKLVADAPAGGAASLTLFGGKEILVGHAQPSDQQTAVIRRFGWDGKPLGQWTAPGPTCTLNRDSSRAACGVGSGRITVTDVATGEPLYRLLGVTEAYWMADGAQLVITPANQSEPRIVTRDGQIKTTAATKVGRWRNPPVPSPVALDAFAIRGAVIDGEGKATVQITADAQRWQLGWIEPWGKNGAELRYLVKEVAPTDDVTDPWPFAPKLQMAPFPAEVWLKVEAAPGDCLNLRAGAGTGAGIIRCLPGGTKVLPTPATGQEAYKDGQRWLPVTTEKGEAGWIAISTGNVGYAD